jgi:plasmid stabilization system protein ParE
MAYRFEFTARAMSDADEAYHWLKEKPPERAARWYEGLFEQIETLNEHPRRCPLAAESDAFDEEIRQLLFGRRQGVYQILFVVRGEVISILSIRHGARNRLRPEELDEVE